MGCAASKLENEDTVRRCKQRRLLMKEAVHSRHHLAAAHADYCRSLRITGSALCSFAAGEQHLSVSEQTPAVFLQPASPAPPPRVPPVSAPSPRFSPSPSPTMVSSKLPHILSASGGADPNSNSTHKPTLPPAPRHHPRRRIPHRRSKLPHILSESSLPGTSPARSLNSNYPSGYYYEHANSTYSTTPSQASTSSSAWNWENFYPPSPPDSEFFDRKAREAAAAAAGSQHHLDVEEAESSETETDAGTERSEYDFFRPQGQADGVDKRSNYSPFTYRSNYTTTTNNNNNNNSKMGGQTEREEVQCSDWGDHDHHYSPTSSSPSSSSGAEETISGTASRAPVGESFRNTTTAAAAAAAEINTSASGGWAEAGKQQQQPNISSSGYEGAPSQKLEKSESSMRMVVRHKDLKEIVDAIKDNFDKAASAGEQVSDMLEIGRAQLDRSFRHLKKTVYHSNNILSNLSSSWTSKPPLAVKYRLELDTTQHPSGCVGPTSLCSTLERLLAWEKKLYQDVKAREGIKIEHEKKLSTLQSQEYKGEDEAKLDKTKASIKKLQSLIIVTSQAVSTTSTAIVGLRDSDLVPQLVELCHGLMYMWRSMYQYHEVQNNVVQQVRGLVNQSRKGESTSELHRQATRDLESAVSAWHSSFCRLVKFQRDFLGSIHGWFKLTLLPVSNDNMNGIAEPSDVYNFFDEWKHTLDRVPDTVASEAIKSFINVVHAIGVKQMEELKMKKRTETVSKELEKKASSLRNIERKYYQSYSMVGIGLPNTGPDNGQVLDARDPLAEKKSELASCQRRVEDEMLRHAKAVEVTRAMTLNHLQTGLPGVFQAMTSFSSLFTEALEIVCGRSYAINK